MKKVIFTVVTIITCLSVNGQAVTGDWYGVLKVQGMELRLVFHINESKNDYTATLDSPDQNAYGIPINSVSFENNLLTLKIDQLGAGYTGTLSSEGKINGTFNQGGQSFPLELSKQKQEKKVLSRPQEPKKPYPYHVEEVRFKSDGGKIELAGTLTLPEKEGSFPVAILISGSGPQNRDEEFMTHKPFLVLADHLTRNGIAVLRYDDRGFAESTGEHMSATSLDFAKDVEAAIDYLKSRKEINKKQIGLIGHSEGGLIAPIVAANSKDVDFIVLLAGPGVSGDQILLQQVGLIGKTAGLSDAYIQNEKKVAQGVFDIVIKYKDPNLRERELKKYYEKVFTDFPEVVKNSGMKKEDLINLNVAQTKRAWYKYFIEYDPAISLQKVQCPVLAVNGSKDVQVAPENLVAIKKALENGDNKNFTVKEFPDMNHLFQVCKTGAINEYATIEQTMSPLVLEEVSGWIINQLNE